MIVSEARREANRRNALRSTGPRTEAGKDRSRRNALTHGLSAEVVRLPEHEPAIGVGAGTDPGAVGPTLDWPGFLVEQVGVITSKLRRCDRLDRRYRERIALRAGSHWDDDRRLEAEFLGAGIARDPAGAARSLRMSPQGCDWMIERWSLLARAADRDGSWTEPRRSLAFDLLGQPHDLRGADPCEAIDLEGRPKALEGPAALARREIAALLARKAEVAPADDLDRALAREEAADDLDPALRRLRRHESDLHRRLRWCVAQLAQAAPPPPPPPRPQAGPSDDLDLGPNLGLDPDADLFAEMDAIMAQANALRQPGASRPPVAQPQPPAAPATSRPDPRLALEKAREADRRDKRDRRRS